MTRPTTEREDATMADDISTDDLFPAPADAPAEDAKPKRTRAKKDEPKPREVKTLDNAVDVTPIHWECACGNTNTHELQNCGKCLAPRYTTA